MKKIFFTPGPSQLYPTVKTHIEQALNENIGSISHRSKQFEEIFSHTITNLRTLMNIPESHHVFFLSSGTEAMERIIENCVEKESFHFVNGSFSKRFFITAQELKKRPKKIDAEFGKGFDEFVILASDKGASPGSVQLRTKMDSGLLSVTRMTNETELICLTHNETSSGVMQPLETIYALKRAHPEKLLALDIVSSAPYPKLDFKFLDCVFFSVQKGFGLPAGLGIIIVSPQAMEKSLYLQQKGINTGSYHKFPTLLHYAQKNQTHETPPVLHMYVFNKVIEDMLHIGIEQIREDIDQKAKLLYDFLDSHATLQAFVKEKEFRSATVITIQTGEKTKQMKESLASQGMIVGSGYGKLKETQIRIANFPAIPFEEMKQLITNLDNT